MRVFVAFGFHERDKWVRDHVVPLVEAFGAQVVTGEELAGQRTTEAIRELIRGADGLIAFVTAREVSGALDHTHRWVTDELAIALAGGNAKKVLEVREESATDQGGIAGDRQHLRYDPDNQIGCLVQLARAIGEWSRGMTMRVLLLPEDIVQTISPFITRPGFSCTYMLSQDGQVSGEHPATLLRRPGGLQLTARGIPPSALISVRVQADGRSYVSAYIDADALNVTLEQEV